MLYASIQSALGPRCRSSLGSFFHAFACWKRVHSSSLLRAKSGQVGGASDRRLEHEVLVFLLHLISVDDVRAALILRNVFRHLSALGVQPHRTRGIVGVFAHGSLVP